MSRRRRMRSPFSLFSFQDIITCVSGIFILITLILALELSQRKPASAKQQTIQVAAQLRDAIAQTVADVAQLQGQLEEKTSRARKAAGFSAEEAQRQLFQINEQIQSLTTELKALHEQEAAAEQASEKLQAEQFNRTDDRKKLADLESKNSDLDEQLRRVQQSNKIYYNPRTADGKKVWLVQIEVDRILVAPAGQNEAGTELSLSSSLFRGSTFSKWLDARTPAGDFLFLLVKPGATEQFRELREVVEDQRFDVGFDVLGLQQSAVDLDKGAGVP